MPEKKVFTSLLLLCAMIGNLLNLSGGAILVFGTTSAGKSTVIQAFMELYGRQFAFLSGDSYLESLEKIPVTEFEGIRARDKFYKTLKKVASHMNVIADMIFINDIKGDKILATLKKIPHLSVLIYCPIHIIFNRVQERNRKNDSQQIRSATLIFRTFSKYYQVAKNTNSHIRPIDTISTFLLKDILSKCISYDLMSNTMAFEEGTNRILSLEERKKILLETVYSFTKDFCLNQEEEITLVPYWQYDLVINSKDKTPYEIARLIYEKVQEKKII